MDEHPSGDQRRLIESEPDPAYGGARAGTWTTEGIRSRALLIIRERGWDAAGHGSVGPVSADWAIAIASGESGSSSPAPDGPYLTTMSELEAVLERGSLVDWEMEKRRTVDQVMTLLHDLRAT